MRDIIPRLHFIRRKWTMLFVASGINCLLLFYGSAIVRAAQQGGSRSATQTQQSQTGEREEAKTNVYITWLDKETAIIALSSASVKQVVVGIAKPLQSELGPGHLYDIPGFKELVPELSKFRAAIGENPQPQKEYSVRSYQLEPQQSIAFDATDKKFISYVRGATTKPDDLDVWDVTTDAGVIRIAFLGNLVLVKPSQISSVHSRVENAMVQLLVNLALSEKRGSRSLALQPGCAGNSVLKSVGQSALSDSARTELRNAVTGKIVSNRGETISDYVLTNTSWTNGILNLNVTPLPTEYSDFRVTEIIGDKDVPILNQRTLEMPPCAAVHILVEPQQWYQEFPKAVDFLYDDKETKLSVQVPEVGLRVSLIYIGAVLAVIVALVIWLLISWKPWKSRRQGTRGRILGASSDGLIQGASTYSSPKRSWWKVWRWRVWSRAEDKASDEDTRERKAEYLQQRLREYKTIHTKFIDDIETALPLLANMDQTLSEFAGLRRQLNTEQAEHKRWKDTLKDLGESPEAVVKAWSDMKDRQQTINSKVFEIETLISKDGAAQDGKKEDPLHALKKLKQEVPRLQQYEKAAVEIGQLVNPTKSETPGEDGATHVVDTVRRLRGFSDSVLSAFAEPLVRDGESFKFSEQSLPDNQKTFSSLVKAGETLVPLEADVRIHLARLVSVRIRDAGKQLERIENTSAEYGRLFTGTGLELTNIARQLQEVHGSLTATLKRVSSKQVRGDNDSSGTLNIDGVLSMFMKKLLSDNYEPLRDMLRLYQVMEVYCRDSSDSVAARLHSQSEEFRKTCGMILADFECLGIHFHKIRFLEDPKQHGLAFTEAASVPQLQNNRDLFNLIQSKLDAGFRDKYWNTVADVAAWGFECDLDPQRNLKTELWLWRSVSTGLSDM